jgi:hypothetical protein
MTAGFNPPAEPDSFEYKVGQGSYTVSGIKCGDRDGTTLIFYPDGKGPFKVALYAHGLGGRLDHGTNPNMDGLDEWMKMVASVGLIVVVPFTGPGSCGEEWVDMLHTLKFTKDHGTSLHPIFAKADWSGVGVWGHSMGAAAVPRIAEHAMDTEYGINVSAIVCSHGAGTSTSLVTVPALFTTGTLDTKDHDDQGNPKEFYNRYRLCRGRPKVYVSLRDGYHMEPLEGKRLNLLTAQFFACHVQGRQHYCQIIYNQTGVQKGGELCARKDLHRCKVDTNPAPSPTPSPTPTPTPVTPSCCFTAWGDETTCGKYPGGPSAQGLCNTDWKTTCVLASDCPKRAGGIVPFTV